MLLVLILTLSTVAVEDTAVIKEVGKDVADAIVRCAVILLWAKFVKSIYNDDDDVAVAAASLKAIVSIFSLTTKGPEVANAKTVDLTGHDVIVVRSGYKVNNSVMNALNIKTHNKFIKLLKQFLNSFFIL